MPNIHGVISIYDRTKKGDFIDGFPTLLLKHKFDYSSRYRINQIMDYIHKNLEGSGQMYSHERILNQSTGESETIRARKTVFSRYLIVIDLFSFNLNNNMSVESTFIKQYLQEQYYQDFLTFLYKIVRECKESGKGKMLEKDIGRAPVYETPYYRRYYRSFDSDD